jgi:hypothetical protein
METGGNIEKGIYDRNNIGRRKRQEELKEGGGWRPGRRGVLRARAWSHLQGGGVVVMVALQPRLLPVYNTKFGFFQA